MDLKCQNGPKMSKWIKMDCKRQNKKTSKSQKWNRNVKMNKKKLKCQMAQKGKKWTRNVQIDQKCQNRPKMSKMDQKSQMSNWTKNGPKMGQKCPK